MKKIKEKIDYDHLREVLRETRWLGDTEDLSLLSRCFLPLIEALNFDGPIRQVCEALPYEPEKIDFIDMVNTMINLGYKVDHSNMNLVTIDNRLLPCLFFPKTKKQNNDYPLLIYEISKDKMRVFNPNSNENKWVKFKNEKFEGKAYFFTKFSDFDKEKDTLTQNVSPHWQSWIRDLIFRFKGLLWQISLLSIAINFFSLVSPLFVMYVYDKIIGSRAIDALIPIVFGALLAIVVDTILREARMKSFSWLGVRLDSIVSNAIFERLILFNPRYTESASVSSQVARMRDFESVREFIAGPLGTSLLQLPFTAIYIVAIAILAGPVAAVPIFLLVIYAFLGLLILSRINANMDSGAMAGSLKQTLLIETMTKMKAIKGSVAANTWMKRYRELSGRSSVVTFNSSLLTAIMESSAYGLSIIAGLSTLTVGIILVWNETITSGALIASMMIVWKVISPAQTVCVSLSRIRQLGQSIKQVHRLFLIKPEVFSRNVVSTRLKMTGTIDFEGVGIRYSNDQGPVLAGFSYHINFGDWVAITGSNGSGKSSTLKMINGMNTPQSGSVRIDGIDLRQMDPIEFRRSMAYVPQRPDIFTGTVAQNMRLANPIATDEEIWKALELAGIKKEIETLPDGIDTVIGGQNEMALNFNVTFLLSFARAVMKDAPIFIMDEVPMAILNSDKGHFIIQYLIENKGKRTIVMVTYREDHMLMATQMIYLAGNGRAMAGDPKELLQNLKAA